MLRTVLVVDTVGSTRLRAAVGDAAFESIRADLVRDLDLVVDEHGGTVLVGTGDGAEVTFPSATAAIEAAVDLQRAVHRTRAVWDTDEPVAYRMGIAVGPGDTARARAHAVCAGHPADSIRLDEHVAALAGTWLDLDLVDEVGRDDAGEHVRWHPTTLGAAVGLPAGTREIAARFVGRTDLRRSVLDRCLASDRAAVVVVEGEPGIGKSELATVVCADTVAVGGTVLRGHCTEPSTGAYQPLVEALELFLERAPLPSTWLGPHPGDLARLSPRLHDRMGAPSLPDLDPETARLRAMEAVAGWIATLAAHAPLILVIDDVQWATPSTRTALAHILRDAPPGLTLLLTRRSTEPAPDVDAWLTNVATRTDLHIETLSGLRDEEAAALVHAHAPGASADLVRWVVDATRGNPFFVEQLARHATSRTAGVSDEEHRGIPTGLRQTIQGRIDAAPPAAREVVQAAAVLGDEFDIPTLLALLDDDVVDDGLESALRAGVVREVDADALRYRFVHGLTRQIAYEGLSGLQRARHHQRVHAALGALSDSERAGRLPERAHHAMSASVLLGIEATLDSVVEAAHHLRRTLAPDVAAEVLERAAGVLTDDRARLTLRVEQAEAWQDAGHSARLIASDAAIALACRLGDGEALARAALARSRGLFSRALSVDLQEVAHLRAALELAGEVPTAVRARLLSQLSMELAFDPDPDAHEGAAEAALACAQQAADPRVLGQVMAARLWTLFHPMAERARVLGKLEEIADTTGDDELAFWADYHAAFTAVRTGEGRRARDAMNRALATAEAIHRPPIRWAVLHPVWLDALMGCRWAEAMAVAAEQAELARAMGNADADSAYRAQGGWVTMETAFPDQARAGLAPLRDRPDLLPPVAVCTYARHAVELGELDVAAALVDRAVRERTVGDPRAQGHLLEVVQLLEAALAVERDDVVGQMVGLLAGREDEHAAIVFATVGTPRRVLGLAHARAGDRDGAVEQLERAVSANDAVGARAWSARARLDLASVLQTTDPRRARELVDEVLQQTERWGLRTLHERAGTLDLA